MVNCIASSKTPILLSSKSPYPHHCLNTWKKFTKIVKILYSPHVLLAIPYIYIKKKKRAGNKTLKQSPSSLSGTKFSCFHPKSSWYNLNNIVRIYFTFKRGSREFHGSAWSQMDPKSLFFPSGVSTSSFNPLPPSLSVKARVVRDFAP